MSEPSPWSALFRKRKAAGLTLTDLAERTGYSIAMLGHCERGIREPSKPLRFACANALGCTPTDLDDTQQPDPAITLDIIAAQHAELGMAIDQLRARLTSEVAA